MKRLGLVALTVAVLVPLVAWARHVAPVDPNDTKGMLDVQRVDLAGTDARPKWTIKTYDGWSVEDIWDTGWGVVHLDTFGDRHFDYYVLVRSDGSHLIATLYLDRRKKDDRRIGRVAADKPNRRTMSVAVRFSELQVRDNESYRWFVRALFTGARCRETCIDRVPDSAAITEGASTPSPVPTP